MSDRYHVQVAVRKTGKFSYRKVWCRVRPTGGDPYVFTKDEAQTFVRSQPIEHQSNYRLEELP